MIIAEIWRYRQLLRSLVVRNLKIKYQRSILGFLWTLLNPLMTVGVLSIVFTHIVKIPMAHYLAFLFSSYFVWNFMLQTISSGTFLLAEHGQLIRSVAFPKEVPVLAGVLSRLVEFSIELSLVLIAVCLWHHKGVPLSFAVLPYLILVQLILSLGLVFPIASLAIFYRDIQHLIPIVLTSLFYISPVFYPVTMVPEFMRPYYMANPVARILTLFRQVIYEGIIPSIADLGAMTLIAVVLLGVGYAIFSRQKEEIAEVV